MISSVFSSSILRTDGWFYPTKKGGKRKKKTLVVFNDVRVGVGGICGVTGTLSVRCTTSGRTSEETMALERL